MSLCLLIQSALLVQAIRYYTRGTPDPRQTRPVVDAARASTG